MQQLIPPLPGNLAWVIVGVTVLSLPALFWIQLALAVKRWHDRGKSGLWVLINIVPWIGGLWSLVELGCLRGTHGPNEYGEDPLASSNDSGQSGRQLFER